MRWRIDAGLRNWLPRLQCHRGFWIEGLQQNSLTSVMEAERRNYKMAEFDVRLTRDHQVILFHDDNYDGVKIDQLTFDEFKRQSLHEYPNTSTLEEVLIWMQQQIKNRADFDFKLNIEIKSKKIFNSTVEKKVYGLIQKYDLRASILVSSFNPFSLYRIRRLEPRIYRALLLTKSDESNYLLNKMVFNFLSQPDVLHLRWNDFDREEFKNLPVPIVLWTVNQMENIRHCRDSIFGIISDEITPDKFK